MSGFHQKVEALVVFPPFNEDYARRLLELFLHSVVDLESVDIGLQYKNDRLDSSLFTITDEHENVKLSLHYKFSGQFKIRLEDRSEGDLTSLFVFIINEDSLLYEMIPEGLREKMNEALMN